MTNVLLIGTVAAIIASGALAIAGIERGIPKLTAVFKPLATLLLLLVVGWPHTSFARLVWAGILLSLVGDVALLSNSDKAFAAGLIAFLAAHVTYIVANFGVARFSLLVPIVAALVIIASAVLLRFARPPTTVLRVAVFIYATAISTMVVSAWATVGGRLEWAPLAAVGAVLFYISDSSLALNRFYRPIPHVSYLALGVYWLGQIGIALAARGPVL
jgi:alkenylglycerophosphocholine/alkenylglycerophosphoethanolamine hydrolase